MTPWWLHVGDCLAWMRALPDKAADVAIFDPPYDAVAHSSQRKIDPAKKRENKRGIVNQPLDFAPMTESDRVACAEQIARCTKRWIVCFCQIETAMTWRAAFEPFGAKYVRTLVWVKPDPTPHLAGDGPGMGYETAVLLHMPKKGRKQWNGGGRPAVYTFVSKNSDRTWEHPTEKPVRLMNQLVSDFSNLGEVVLDPYAGSGTTGASCLRLGRQFLGAEIDPKWAQVARDRLIAEASGMGLPEARQGQRSLFELLPEQSASALLPEIGGAP